jgi:hypothetical protein
MSLVRSGLGHEGTNCKERPLNIAIQNIRIIRYNIQVCPFPYCLTVIIPQNLLAMYFYLIFNRFSLNIIFATIVAPLGDKWGNVKFDKNFPRANFRVLFVITLNKQFLRSRGRNKMNKVSVETNRQIALYSVPAVSWSLTQFFLHAYSAPTGQKVNLTLSAFKAKN